LHSAQLESVPACPSDEDIAAYLDGRLTMGARASVEAHIADCENCRTLFAASAAVADSSPIAVPELRQARASLRYGLPAALAVAAAALIVVTVDGGRSRPTALRSALVQAVGSSRPLEARLSGGFHWGSYGGGLRSGSDRQLPPDLRIRLAEAEATAQELATPAADWESALARLIGGDPDRAIAQLHAVRGPVQNTPEFLNDLAAAYLTRGQHSPSISDARAAVDLTRRAIVLKPRFREALFNHALALERVGDAAAARDAWNVYVREDAGSPWAREARDHLTALSPR
jgi:hypothetical protein